MPQGGNKGSVDNPIGAGSSAVSFSRSQGLFSLHVAWTVVVRLLMTANSLIVGIIVARWLGAEGLGQLGVINVSVAMITQLGSVGLPSANTYFVAKDRKHLLAVAVNSLFFAIVGGGVLALGLMLFASWHPDWFGSIPPELMRLAAISIPFQLISLIGLNIFLAVGDVKRFNLLDLAGPTFVLFNAVLVLVILRRDLWSLVALNTVASVAIAVLIVVLIGVFGTRLKTKHESWRFDPGLLGRMWRYGLKFHISILAGALMFRADLLVVNHFRGAAEAGVYSVASQVAMMLMLLPSVIATLLFPRVTAKEDAGGETTALASRHTAFVNLFACLATVPLSLLLPVLYGPAFADVTLQLLILLPGVYLIGLESVLVQHFNAIGLPFTIPLFWIAALAINLLLVFTLVPGFGARGAAAASSLSYFVIFMLVAGYFHVKTKRSLSESFVLRRWELRRLLAVRKRRAVDGSVAR